MRIVRTRSIPNVDDQRLISDLARLHCQIHTAVGLHTWDRGHGRHLVDAGLKIRKIVTELIHRGYPPPVCRYCRGS